MWMVPQCYPSTLYLNLITRIVLNELIYINIFPAIRAALTENIHYQYVFRVNSGMQLPLPKYSDHGWIS